jgi:hypothetical protein
MLEEAGLWKKGILLALCLAMAMRPVDNGVPKCFQITSAGATKRKESESNNLEVCRRCLQPTVWPKLNDFGRKGSKPLTRGINQWTKERLVSTQPDLRSTVEGEVVGHSVLVDSSLKSLPWMTDKNLERQEHARCWR